MLRGVLLAAAMLAAPVAGADGFRKLEGHGGPVMSVATDGSIAVTASFDNSVAIWSGSGKPRFLDGHEAAVKAVAITATLVASGGDDHQVIVWDRATGAIRHRLKGHRSRIMSLAVSPDGRLVASASWDRRIGIWDASKGALVRWITGHRGNVNDVVFGPGGTLFSASHDGTVRQWRVADGKMLRVLARHGFGVNRLLVNPDADWLAYGALDGGTRVLSLKDGRTLADITLDRRPILAMAMRGDGRQVAVGDGQGHIMVVRTADWSITHDFRAARRGPVWALAYTDGGRGLIAGGIEDAAYVWPLADLSGSPRMGLKRRAFHTDPTSVGNGERQFLRKCSVCHSLRPGGSRKAGPSLHGVFGRKAGTYPGYTYSQALRGARLIWSEKTIDKLFALGPDHFTPGSKMPMQQIARAEDRADLIRFLKKATAPK